MNALRSFIAVGEALTLRTLTPCRAGVRRRAHVDGGASAAGDVDDRVRLLDAGAPDAARTVVFEAAPDDPDAVRQQRRGDGVALEAADRRGRRR